MHGMHGLLHMQRAEIVQLHTSLHNLLQKSYQNAQITRDGLLVIRLRLRRIRIVKLQHIGRRLMQLLVQRLKLGAQVKNRLIFRSRLTVKPLSQHTSCWIRTAGKFHAGIQGIA